MTQERQSSLGSWIAGVTAAMVLAYAASFVPVYGWIANINDPWATPVTVYRNDRARHPARKQMMIRCYAPMFLLCEASPAMDGWVAAHGPRIYYDWFLTKP